MKEIRPFVENLKKAIGVEVEYHPEFMTSIEAEHIQGKGDMLDASAAALILKSYIDHKKR
jgi:RNase H-fold protein (predicted Holliday junction resolvase)